MNEKFVKSNNVTHIVFCTTGGSEHFADRGVKYLTTPSTFRWPITSSQRCSTL